MHFKRSHDDRQTIMVEKIQNVCGSTAGAGSGEFHNYRRQRRKERARLMTMEREEAWINAQAEFDNTRDEKANFLDEGTEKRRLKREKKKLNKKEVKQAKKMNQFESNGSFLEQFCAEHEPEIEPTLNLENPEPNSAGSIKKRAPTIFVITPNYETAEGMLGKRSHKSSCVKSNTSSRKASVNKKPDENSDSESEDADLVKSNLENLLKGMATGGKKLKS